MRLHLKQKVFSFSGEFSIKDDSGFDKYVARAEIFSWGHKYHVYDTTHQEVIYVEQKVFSLMPRYFIYIEGLEVAQIVKRFTFFKPKYELLAEGWEIEGDMWGHNYTIIHEGKLIATIQKEWFTWGDSYYVDINDQKHELMCLAIVIAIDCVMASQAAASSASSSN